jgi:aldose 1-epimerase
MIHLHSGSLTCAIEPRLGACIAGLWLDGVPVLRAAPAAGIVSARQAACYPLVPFANRLAHARLQWQGTLYPLVRNDPIEAHAINGIGWQRPWDTLDSDERFAMLSFEHRADAAAWPFAFDCSQTFRLRDRTLELTLSLTNQSHEPAPAGLGWHPVFAKRPGARLSFAATGRWETADDPMAPLRVNSEGINADCASLQVDHCYDGWDGSAWLRDERLSIQITSNLARLVVFTDPSSDAVVIEPVSHVNDAIALAAAGVDAAQLGLVTLAPGESTSARMTVEVGAHP